MQDHRRDAWNGRERGRSEGRKRPAFDQRRKKEEKEEREKDRFVSERRYGAFQRAFQLPPGVDADKIDATFAKGVLTVHLPKTAEAMSNEKKITVNAA
ncbi:Hsp20/alpha crystallin family protein [Sinorhizobium psoraleae]|uniref:Hsp20/alpha crystallin family protein n=1 Tax=Sinorhizobium psoraleae TaxID=520838 RepID=UPI00289BA0E7|nr:Hsp20/alpha crystallin family protein [Sinorhizobium psoraleae]